jgi:hypothetical protein
METSVNEETSVDTLVSVMLVIAGVATLASDCLEGIEFPQIRSANIADVFAVVHAACMMLLLNRYFWAQKNTPQILPQQHRRSFLYVLHRFIRRYTIYRLFVNP